MRFFLLFSFLASVAVVIGCQDVSSGHPSSPETAGVSSSATVERDSVKSLFAATDSIELLHYDDPKNQKEYSRHIVTDPAIISAITSSLQAPEVVKSPCGNDFRLYLFRKGEVFKTVYAATGDSCKYLAYVINGVNYYLPLTDTVSALLKRNIEPARLP